MLRRLVAEIEKFPLTRPFSISRGAKREAEVVTVSITSGGATGRGECVPYARYGETPESVVCTIESVRSAMEQGIAREALRNMLPPGAARNALDCALWDLDAKRLGIRAHEIAGFHRLSAVTTAYTISLGNPHAMGEAAAQAGGYPVLKIKLGGEDDESCLRAVREAAPDSELIVDANEGWKENEIEHLVAACEETCVRLIEQPLPAGRDEALRHFRGRILFCADESIHGADDLDALSDRYDAINIKLDKTGGLTSALELARKAQALDFKIMIGSMVGTSLAMAPAMLLTPYAQWIDLDGPLLLARDRVPRLKFEGATLFPPEAALWG
jgi:L-alanine-DL-glutamate epimerase-like enolase superfamily enzyme